MNDSEEEEMVRRVGGRGRGLVQAVLRIRRERAGRAPQNLDQTIDPETVDTTDRQRTRPRPKVSTRTRPNNPPPTLRLP